MSEIKIMYVCMYEILLNKMEFSFNYYIPKHVLSTFR